MARATTRDVARDSNGGDLPALEQEVFALRRELRLLQLANEELERLVVRDTLTPLFNRRHFISCLADRLSRLERYGTLAALVFVDVNGMKLINDNYGHSAGDYALLHISRLLAASVRSTDIAARVGGDEFALLLDGVTEDGARDKASQLAAAIAASECRFGEDVLMLSASFGCTALRPGDSDFSAIARADMAMYSAKRRIGNGYGGA
ncbi:GGDEF domain-containing protein [Sphingobium nicotianae]|uniref:diguanylate cyclase n=1 Tax=Sphingobium nicotianae TaxID=2782607 RepID=A0A9X1DDL5_9SPHN|nr:GGDEF domain-containing protein [Sphingobium nicotianae]MBT2187959.1 GGDEF domain-containing protein [Sphingobium nicotianae]